MKKLLFSLAICLCILNVTHVFGQDEETTTTEQPTSTSTANSTVKKESKKVNWTEVEMKWNEVLDDDVVHEKWKKLEENLKAGIKNVLRMLFPKVVSMSSETKVSSNCTAGMLKWVLSLRNLKDWSVKMLDAIGKPSAGVLDGAITMFGNYKECLNVRSYEDDDELDDFFDTDEPKKPVEKKEFFRGKYCVLELKPYLPAKPHFYGLTTKLKALQIPVEQDSIFKLLIDHAALLNVANLRFDLCVPSLCEREDIQKIVSYISKSIDFKGRVSRCETDPEYPVELNLSQLIAISSLIVLIFLFGASTFISIVLLHCKFKGTLVKLTYNLSWLHSYRELAHFASYQQSHLKAPVLYGVRYIILFWIMLVHTAAIVNFQFLRDMLPMKDLAMSQPAQIVTKSAIQMDALILITAFTMGYNVEGNSFKKIARYVMKKYLRLMPAIMIVTALMVLLTTPLAKPLLDGGATWTDVMVKPTEACERTGIFNFFFIQNFIHPAESCLSHTWLFAVEMQLALLFIPVLLIRYFNQQIGTILNIILIAIGFIVNVITVYKHQLPPTYLITLPDLVQRDYYFNVHYFLPWTHLSTFGAGILAGCYSSKLKKLEIARRKRTANIHYSKSSNPTFISAVYIFGWIVCISTLASVIFSYNDWVKGDLPDPLSSGFYDASQRLSWSLAQCFILYFLVCVLNERSFLTRFLGSKVFIFLGRLCLLAYIIHPVWQLIFLSTQHTQIYSSRFVALYSMFGNIVASFILAFVISLFLEIPIASLLVSRSIVSSEHPVKPLLGKKIPVEEVSELNMYSINDSSADFRMQNNNNNITHPNHNEFMKENYKF